MNLTDLLIFSLVAYSGLYFGLFLSLIAKEELAQGKKYFLLLKKIMLFLIIIAPAAAARLHPVGILVTLIPAVFLVIEARCRGLIDPEIIRYSAFGLMIGVSAFDKDILSAAGSLIFIYGLLLGTLKTKVRKTKETALSLLKYSVIILAAACGYGVIGLFL